jgi:hypothetical protein
MTLRLVSFDVIEIVDCADWECGNVQTVRLTGTVQTVGYPSIWRASDIDPTFWIAPLISGTRSPHHSATFLQNHFPVNLSVRISNSIVQMIYNPKFLIKIWVNTVFWIAWWELFSRKDTLTTWQVINQNASKQSAWPGYHGNHEGYETTDDHVNSGWRFPYMAAANQCLRFSKCINFIAGCRAFSFLEMLFCEICMACYHLECGGKSHLQVGMW